MSQTSELLELSYDEAKQEIDSWDVPAGEKGQEICDCGQILRIKRQIRGVTSDGMIHSYISGMLLECQGCRRHYRISDESKWVI